MVSLKYILDIWFEVPIQLPQGVHPSEVIVRCSPYRPQPIDDTQRSVSQSVEDLGHGMFFVHTHSEFDRQVIDRNSAGQDYVRNQKSDRDIYSLFVTQPEEIGISLKHFSPAEQALFKIAAAVREVEHEDLTADWVILPVEDMSNPGYPEDDETGLPLNTFSKRITDDIRFQRVTDSTPKNRKSVIHIIVRKSAFPAL